MISNLFFDIETSGPSPVRDELIAIGMIATDKDYNEIARLEEFCRPIGERIITNVFGREHNQWPDATGSNNPAIRNATDVHGINWNTAKDFQQPIDLYRKMWSFLDKIPGDINMVYHSESKFDPRFLFYRSSLHAPILYKELNRRTHFWEYEDECDKSVGGVYRLRYDDTMGMARRYIKQGSDGLKIANKLQKQVEKYRNLITKDRKTPAKPEKMQEWKDKLADIENELVLMEFSDVELEGYALDKVCRSLNIPLKHHDAMSDTKALIPIHKFLSKNLS